MDVKWLKDTLDIYLTFHSCWAVSQRTGFKDDDDGDDDDG